jgi:hypothetical protein
VFPQWISVAGRVVGRPTSIHGVLSGVYMLLGAVYVVVFTPAVYPRFVEFLHFDIQSTGQKSHCVNIFSDHRNALF